MLTYNARPGESGQQLAECSAPLGTHIPAERDIHASSGWLWQERSTLQRISQSFSGARLLTARSIYLALTECASQQRTPGRAHSSCAYLGSLAGCSERSARRYLHEFTTLGLIEVVPGVHRANTYILLMETALRQNLAQAVMPLADGDGKSVAPDARRTSKPARALAPANIAAKRRAASGDPPAPAVSAPDTGDGKGDAGRTLPVSADRYDRPDQARGDIPDSQDLTNESNKPKNQTNRAGGDIDAADNVREAGVSLDQQSSDTNSKRLIPSDEQRAAICSLTGIGVRRVLAEELAASHDAITIRAWVCYALKAAGLKSKAGFVLSRLRAGEQPPFISGSSSAPMSINDQQPARGQLEAPAAQQLEEEMPQPETIIAPPPTGGEQAIWQVAREELLAEASSGAKLWLQHMRLISVAANRLVLSSPPVGGAATANLYTERIVALLGEVLGYPVQVKFQSGW